MANAETPRANQRWWLMALLTAIYTFNYVDRTILNVLQQSIKTELKLKDWQLGLLGGTAFAIFYTLMGLYVAGLAERKGRVKTLTGSAVLWSTFTALCAAAGSFYQLLALRVAVAVGEAGATPIGHSLISGHFRPERRAGAIAIFQTGSTLGIILGALIGGLVGGTWGWRWAFLIAGAPGLILAAALYFTIREPREVHAAADIAAPTARAVARLLFGKATFRNLAIAASLSSFASLSIVSFSTPHLMRSFGLSLKVAALLAGVGAGIALAIGTISGGFVAQLLARRDRRWMMWTPAIATLIAAPMCFGAFATDNLVLWGCCFAATNACIGTFQAPVFSTNHSLVRPRMRATASAILLMLLNLFAAGVGPLFTGAASDLFARGFYGSAHYQQLCAAGTAADMACRAASASGLRAALMLSSIFLLVSAIFFFRAAGSIRTEVVD